MDMNNSCLMTMSNDELLQINGGGWLIVTGIVIGCCVCFGLGVYNGYKDTKSGK